MSMTSSLTSLLPELRAYAQALTSNSHSAQDLVQDAVERALRAESCPSRKAELRPWLFRVIRNLHYDELRKYRVRREYLQRDGRYIVEISQPDAQSRDLGIRMAFERLPAEKKDILFLVDVAGFRYAEVARIIDVPIGTVMSRVSRARKSMLEELGETERLAARKQSDGQ